MKLTKSSTNIRDGLRIAYQTWGSASSHPESGLRPESSEIKRILCLHGWLDNSNSFQYLGPNLAERGFEVTALDQPGHGWSGHVSGLQTFPQYIEATREFIGTIGYDRGDKFHLIGHSMGAGISILLAGCYPELVDKLVLLEGFGPMTSSPSRAVRNLRAAVDARVPSFTPSSQSSEKSKAARTVRKYPNFEAALEARIRTVSTYPGKQYISREAARAIVQRSTVPYGSTYGSGGDPSIILESAALEASLSTSSSPSPPSSSSSSSLDGSEPVNYTHDPQLLLPSHSYFTDDQIIPFFEAIQSRTLLLLAEDGWPGNAETFRARKSILEAKDLFAEETLPGSHHFHLDPVTSDKVLESVVNFLG